MGHREGSALRSQSHERVPPVVATAVIGHGKDRFLCLVVPKLGINS
ncbi:hypothetical protein FDUTEX481_07976 [Tolypothrix sp. PCC 7601]|nr:hypothetical protein FDUTEX481_07976 [Tolypothrix sp. PCC 7601]